jgi:hypothetical protein
VPPHGYRRHVLVETAIGNSQLLSSGRHGVPHNRNSPGYPSSQHGGIHCGVADSSMSPCWMTDILGNRNPDHIHRKTQLEMYINIPTDVSTLRCPSSGSKPLRHIKQNELGDLKVLMKSYFILDYVNKSSRPVVSEPSSFTSVRGVPM